MNTVMRVLLVWALMTAVTAATSGFSWNNSLAALLTVAVLTLVVRATNASGWSLASMLFTLYFGITWVNTHIEAVLFHVMSPNDAAKSLVLGAATAFMVAMVLTTALNRWIQTPESLPGTARTKPWRILLAVLA